MSLDGKIALVTGSTSGIGLGIACKLAEAGAHVMLNGFGEVDAAVSRVSAYGTRVLHHRADVSDPDQIADMVSQTEREFGALDVLVNNAGIQHVAPVEAFSVERWNSILAINLSSAFHSIRLALPGMRERNWGRIINVSSVHGLVASAQKSAYVAAKHGLIGLTKSVALETATTGITCNALCPGWVLTPLVQQQIDHLAKVHGDAQRATRELLMEKQPSLDFVTPEQLGELALFLCSEAAKQVRGVAWNMDGGWVAQ